MLPFTWFLVVRSVDVVWPMVAFDGLVIVLGCCSPKNSFRLLDGLARDENHYSFKRTFWRRGG